ncbi:MAG: type III-B CRISPR module RAMP protein Cmr1 [Desulfobacterales bacterium]|nr:type III-B CRISPR module RAMP protein Cmr1 [Desulfobacterales bacterium]
MPIKITVRCKTVTPMLASGANQQEFEIRASEIKYGLRFWWRAFQSFSTIEELYKNEIDLFGGASSDNTGRASSFKLFINNINGLQFWNPGTQTNWGDGINYIFFSIVDRQGMIKPPIDPKDPKKSGRKVAKPGANFTIHINFHQRNNERFGDVLCSLWLFVNMGGIGGRTRRGAGSFEITELKIDDKIIDKCRNDSNYKELFNKGIPSFEISNDQSPAEFIRDGVNIIFRRWNTNAIRTKPVTYTAFDPNTSDILVLYDAIARNSNSAMDIMNIIGAKIGNYCDTYPYDEACSMHKTLSTQVNSFPSDFFLNKVSKGLPIVYNFKEEFGNIRGQNLNAKYIATTALWDDKTDQPKKEKGDIKEGGRRSSPLIISCHKKGDKSYAVICFLPAPIISNNEKFWLKSIPNKPELDVFFNSSDKPPFAPFINEMLYDKKTFKDRKGDEQIKSPITSAFKKIYKIHPYKEIVNPTDPPQRPAQQVAKLKISNWLSRANSIKKEDSFIIKQIIQEINKLFSDDKEQESEELKNTLEKKLNELGIRKLYKF